MNKINEIKKNQIEIFQRYKEIKLQLKLQLIYSYKNNTSTSLPSSSSSSSSSNINKNNKLFINKYLSWPEHFNRIQINSSFLSYSSNNQTPWEGSEYLKILLNSLQEKLLLKYTFQHFYYLLLLSKYNNEIINKKYHTIELNLLRNIFQVWKDYLYDCLLEKLLIQKGLIFYNSRKLFKQFNQWKEFISYHMKYQKLYHLIDHKYQINLLQIGFMKLYHFTKEKKVRIQNIIKFNKKLKKLKQQKNQQNTSIIVKDNYEDIFKRYYVKRKCQISLYIWMNYLTIQRKKHNLNDLRVKLVKSLNNRILIKSLCHWLKAIAVSRRNKKNIKIENTKQNNKETKSSQTDPNYQQKQERDEQEQKQEQKKDEQIFDTSQLSNPLFLTPSSNITTSSISLSSSTLSSKTTSTKSSSKRNKQLIFEDTLQQLSSETLEPISLSYHENSLQNNNQNENQNNEQENSKNEESSSNISTSLFQIHENALPLTYAIYAMENQMNNNQTYNNVNNTLVNNDNTTISSSSTTSTTTTRTQDNEKIKYFKKNKEIKEKSLNDNNSHKVYNISLDNSNLNISSLSNISKYDFNDMIERDDHGLNLQIIETRKRSLKHLKNQVNSYSTSSSQNKKGNLRLRPKDEAERRFRKYQLYKLTELFLCWKLKTYNCRIFRHVFQLCLERWEDRIYRLKSDFGLLLQIFSCWKEVIEIKKEFNQMKILNRKALVFRGMNLLSRGFNGWLFGMKEKKRQKQEIKLKQLIILAESWIQWIYLIKELRDKVSKAINYYNKKLLKNCFNRFKSYLEFSIFEQQTVNTIIGYIKLRKYLENWRLHWKYHQVLRHHGYNLIEREQKEVRRIFNGWLRCYQYRYNVRIGIEKLQKLLTKYRAFRILLNWPGRKDSIAASKLSQQILLKKKRQLKHQNAINNRIIEEMISINNNNVDNNQIIAPLGETPIDSNVEINNDNNSLFNNDNKMINLDLCENSKVSITPPIGNIINGSKVQLITSLPQFQFSNHKNIKSLSNCTYQYNNNGNNNNNNINKINCSSNKLISNQKPHFKGMILDSIPKIPPHHLRYQNLAIKFGYSDGFLPTRNLITKFLQTILQHWRDYTKYRIDITKRGLFLRACVRLRQISKIFYQWISKTSRISYRNIVWIKKNKFIPSL